MAQHRYALWLSLLLLATTIHGEFEAACGALQVFPVHEVGFGASDDIFISASTLRGASSVALDGETCVFRDATTVACPIRAYGNGLPQSNVAVLLASNASVIMVLVVDGQLRCPLSATADGSLRRSASRTAVLTSVQTVWSAADDGLQLPHVHITWQPSEQQRALVSSGMGDPSSVAVGTTMFMVQLPDSGSAVFPVYPSLAGASLVNVSLMETMAGDGPENGRRYEAIVRPSIRYIAFPPRRIVPAAASSGTLMWVPVVRAIYGHTDAVYVPPTGANTTEVDDGVRVLLCIVGTFPWPMASLPTVHVVDAHARQAAACTVVFATAKAIECVLEVHPEVANGHTNTQLGLGSGYATRTNASRTSWLPAPPMVQRPRVVGEMGNTDAWNMAGNWSRGLLRLPLPTGNASFRLHCASTLSMAVVDATTNASLCVVDAAQHSGNNVSVALPSTEGVALALEVNCCLGDGSNETVGNDGCPRQQLCAVSLEVIPPAGSSANDGAPQVAIFEVTSLPWVMPDSQSSLAEVLGQPSDLIANLTTNLALRVPYISDVATCEGTTVEDLVVTLLPPSSACTAGASSASDDSTWCSPAEVQHRYAVPGFNGSWRPHTRRCTWHLVTPVEDCTSALSPLSIALGHLVYCGARSLFFDPIPLSMVEVPLEVDDAASIRDGANGTTSSGRYWPHVAFPGHAVATTVARSADDGGYGAARPPFSMSFHRSRAAAAGGVQVPVVNVSTLVVPGGSSVNVSVLVPEGSNSSATWPAAVCNQTRVALVAPSDASWAGLRRVSFGRCAVNTSNSSGSNTTSWTVLIVNVSVPTDLPAGYYRLILFLHGYQAVAWPPTAVALTAATAVSSFLWVAATVRSSSTEAIGSNGGGTITLQGTNFPVGAASTTMQFVVSDVNGTVEVPAELLVGSSTSAAWVVGDASNVTGPRTLNTIQASWRLSMVVASWSPQSILGTIGILQPASLPKIVSVTPLLLSAAQAAVFTVVGTALSLKTLSVCAEGSSNGLATPSVVTPFHERVLQTCEVCVPTFSNSTYAVCNLSTKLRMGLYAMYVSSPSVGTAFEGHLRFSLGIHAVTPLEASPYGMAMLTVAGEAFVEGWAVCLERSTTDPLIPCHITANTTSSVVCQLPAVDDPVLLEGTSYVAVLRHIRYGYTLRCPQPALCTVQFSSHQLPTLTSVMPRHGQSPMVVTVFGLLFTGNATWVNEAADNLALYVGSSPCVVERPVYYDRIVCRLLDPCDSTQQPQVRAVVHPFGSTATAFDANLRFTCAMEVLRAAPLVGSAMGGQSITIAGNGFPAQPVVRVAGELCDVSSVTATAIVCTTRGLGGVMDLSGAVTVVAADDVNVRGSCCTYTYAAAITPIVDTIAPTTGSEGVRATVIGSRFASGVQVEMSGILITDAVVLSSTSINLLIPRLPPAVARLTLSIAGIGYAFHAATLENFTYSLAISRITPSRGSYQSGLMLTIVGSGLGINNSSSTAGSVVVHQPTTHAFICGRRCPLVTTDFNLLVCSVPPYMDVFMLQQYPSSATQGPLTASDMTVYRRAVVEGNGHVAWTDVTPFFLGTSQAGLPPMTARSTIEQFLIASPKHARLSLTALRMSLQGVRNISQNVSCVLQRGGSSISSIATLDPSISDWGNRSHWSSTALWTAMSMLDGETANDLASRYDTGRFFLLTCERLVVGETQIASGQVEGVVVGVNAVGGVCPINIVVASVSEVFESCPDPLGASCSSFVYDSTLTPILAASSVAYALSTAPTRLTLTGSGFGVSVDAVPIVVVGGLACQVQLAQESSLVCVTQGRLRSPVVMDRGVSIVGKGLAKLVGTEPFRGVEPWSSPASWYASMPPTTPGSIVHIPAGALVVLDCPPPRLTAIVVEGTLVIADVSMNIELGLLLILEGGVVQGGNAVTPLASLINFTFVPTPSLAATDTDTNDGNLTLAYRSSNTTLAPWPHMAIIVDGGSLHLSGTAEAIVSSYLQQTATAGTRSVVIQDRVGWVVGATVLVTSTTPVLEEAEERVVVAKTLVGSTAILELDQPLRYTHLRSTETFLKNTMEVSARVVLLTRNVLIQGDAGSDDSREGVSMYLLNQAHIVLRSIGLFRCGKAATTLHGAAAIELSNVRYPEAFPVAQRIVVRQSYHRGIVLRSTRMVSLLDNVVYRTDGHGVAALGGDCWNTSLSANIVCRTQRTLASSGDLVPANFYLTNPSVSMTSNVGSGSHGHCVWFDLYNDQLGNPNPTCASQRSILLFSNNVLNGAARDGMRITPTLLARALPCVDRALGLAPDNPFVTTSIAQTVIFACGGHGIFVGPVGALTISSCIVLDVGEAGFSCGASAGAVLVSDSLMSGLLADGTTLLQPSMPTASIAGRSGIVLRGGAVGFTISNVLIRNATRDALTTCPTVDAEAATVPVFVSSSKLTISGTNLSYHARFCGKVVLFDTDGSLTQLQREAYVIAGALDTLQPSRFSMCRTFNDTDLAYAVSNRIVARSTGSNATLLMCETQSTYLFFAVSVTLHGCPGCSRVAVDVFHDGAFLTNFTLNATVAASGDATATFLVVDGRPSTVTAFSTIFSSRLQYLLTPECSGLVDRILCQPQAVLLTRVGALRPNFPSQFLIDAKNNAVYMVEATTVLPQWTLPRTMLAFHQVWLSGAPVTTVRYEASTEEQQCTLVNKNSTHASNRSAVSSWLLSVWFSATQVSEGIRVSLVACPSGSWCVPPLYPTTAAPLLPATTNWTNASSWFAGVVPTSRAPTVAVVPQGVKMRLNVNATGLQALVVVGTLIVDADAVGTSLVLECTQLIVLGTMAVVASSGRYTATVRIRTQQDMMLGSNNDTHTMCANSTNTSLVLSPALSVRCGTVLVSGSLNATGAVRSTWWPVRNSIAGGSRSFEAESSRMLQAGWAVGLTSSDARYPAGAWNRLTSSIAAGDDATDVVQVPWQHRHSATRLTRSVARTVEAVNFEKSVQFECANPTSTTFVAHCRIVVYRPPTASSLALLSANAMSFFHVRVDRFGCYAAATNTTLDALDVNVPTAMVPGSPAIHVSATASSVRLNHTLIVNASHVALYVAPNAARSTTVVVINAVVWNSIGSGIVLSGKQTAVRNTLVAGVTLPRHPSTAATVTPVCGVLELDGGNVVNTTTVAGSESEGFCLPWTACQLPYYAALTARACAVGVFLYDPSTSLDNPSEPCAAEQVMGGGVEVFQNSFIGIVSTQHTSITLSGVVSAANPIGVYAGSRLGVAGVTRIVSSTFGGGSLAATAPSACAPPPCSPSFALHGIAVASCYGTWFANGFENTGILLVPHAMASVPLWYNRSTPITARVAPNAFKTVFVDTTTINSVSFIGFGQCGTAVAYNPMATGATYPQVTTTAIRLDDTPRRIYAPPSTTAIVGAEEEDAPGSCADPSKPCDPSQGLVVSDTDGSIRGQNATSTIVRYQSAADLLQCSAFTDVLSTCPTSVPLGRLVVESVDDFQGMMVGCFQATAYSSVLPTFATCAAASRGNGLVDPVVSATVLTGVELRMDSATVPRNLRLSLQHCTSPVLLTLQMVETNMRVTVWVGGVERVMGQTKPKLTDRHGEWYRNPLLVGDDVSGDIADWMSVVLQCGQSVRIHHMVRGTFRMILNTSVSLITYGHRGAIGDTIATLAGRPTETVFVSSVTPSTPRTQCVVTVLLEGLDGSTYNATREAATINAALHVLAKMDMVNLSTYLGLLAFSSTATPVQLTLHPEPPTESLFTLTNVLGLTGALAGLAGIGMLFYWYLLGLRYSVRRQSTRQYNGIVFGAEVDVLPSTDANSAFLIEDTVVETSKAARQRSYLDEWKIPFSRNIFTDTILFGSSVKSSSTDSSESERPLAPPSATFLDLDPETHLPVGSVITAFLQTNQHDRRMRSPRQPSVEMKTPLANAASSINSRHGAPQPFQLEPSVTPSPDTAHGGSDASDAVGCVETPPVHVAGGGTSMDIDTPVCDALDGSAHFQQVYGNSSLQTPRGAGGEPSHDALLHSLPPCDSFLRKSPRRVSFAFGRATTKDSPPQLPGHLDGPSRRCPTPRTMLVPPPPLPPPVHPKSPIAEPQASPSAVSSTAQDDSRPHPTDGAATAGPQPAVRRTKRSRFTSSKW